MRRKSNRVKPLYQSDPLEGADLLNLHRSSSSRGPSTKNAPIKLFRIKQLPKDEKVSDEEMVLGEKEQLQDDLDGVRELNMGKSLSSRGKFRRLRRCSE